MRIAAPVAAVLAAGLALGGCVSAPASDTPDPTAGLQPAQVFDGSCDGLASTAELSAIVGVEVAPRTTAYHPQPETLAIEQSSGIYCLWVSEGAAVTVVLTALPEAAAPGDSPAPCQPQGSGAAMCGLEASLNGIRLSGLVLTTAISLEATRAMAEQILALFEERAVPGAAVTVAVPSESDWFSSPTWDPTEECESIANALDDVTIEGDTHNFQESFVRGSGLLYDTAVTRALGQTPACLVYSGHSGNIRYNLDFSHLGGGRWAESRVAELPGVTEEAVPGLDLVYVSPAADDGSTMRVDVFQGSNWLQLFVPDHESQWPAVVALVSVLDDM